MFAHAGQLLLVRTHGPVSAGWQRQQAEQRIRSSRPPACSGDVLSSSSAHNFLPTSTLWTVEGAIRPSN